MAGILYVNKWMLGILTTAIVALFGCRKLFKLRANKTKEKDKQFKDDLCLVLFFPDPQPSCKTHFIERRGCTRPRCRFSHDPSFSYAQLLSYLKDVRKSFDLCIYTISCTDLADVIVDLHKKGVIVRIITDDEQMDIPASQVWRFRSQGIQVRQDASSFFMHHKFVVLDGTILINGSFNWTRQAITGNHENLVITNNEHLVSEFTKEFEKLWTMFDPRNCKPVKPENS